MLKKISLTLVMSLVLLVGFTQIGMAYPQNCHAYATSIAPIGTEAWLDAYEMCHCYHYGCL